MDFLSVILSAILIGWLFSLCIVLYILASRAYSSKQIRLKKYPFIGFLIVIIFQGAFTFLMVNIGISNLEFQFTQPIIFILIACSLQISGAYPLTQIYQHKADLADGVTTISYKLGYKGTFIFTGIMFGICNLFYFLYFKEMGRVNQFSILQLFFIPIVIYFISWFIKVNKNIEEANFKNTMKMNSIAAICMNSCFIILSIINLKQ